jgi:hypothetical protein
MPVEHYILVPAQPLLYSLLMVLLLLMMMLGGSLRCCGCVVAAAAWSGRGLGDRACGLEV